MLILVDQRYEKCFTGKTRTARCIPVRQLTGTRTDRYRAVPLRSSVGGRFRPSTVDFRHRWSISTVCGRFKEKSTVSGRLRKKKERRRGEVPRTALAATSPGGRPRAVAARAALAPKKKRKRRRRRREVPRTALAATPRGGRPQAIAARAALAPPHAGESSRQRHGENRPSTIEIDRQRSILVVPPGSGWSTYRYVPGDMDLTTR
ncbi:hypothetical protein GW17_00023848 [Ensete ventricosum]|nr:hypothetical protein GW17_00023848 [Ensete ventricosum]